MAAEPPAAPLVYRHSHQVGPEEIDELGHASNLCYLRWVMDAASAHSADRGWPLSRFIARGSGWVVRRHEIRYLRPAGPGERLAVLTWVASIERYRSRRDTAILREADGQKLATARTEWVFVDYSTGAPRPIPPEVLAEFAVADAPV